MKKFLYNLFDNKFYFKTLLFFIFILCLSFVIEILLFFITTELLITSSRTIYGNYRYSPNKSFVIKSNETNKLVNIKINEVGVRDKRFSSTNKIKIGVIGDSYVFARDIDMDNRFTEILQKKMDKTGKSVEIYNIGVEGANPANYYTWINYLELNYDFDFYIILISNDDDFNNNQQKIIIEDKKIQYFISENKVTKEISTLNNIEKFKNDSLIFLRKSELIRVIEMSIRGSLKIVKNGGMNLSSKIQSYFKDDYNLNERSEVDCNIIFKPGSNIHNFNLAFMIFSDIENLTNKPIFFLQLPSYSQINSYSSNICDYNNPENLFNNHPLRFKYSLLNDFKLDNKQLYFQYGHLNENGHDSIAKLIFSNNTFKQILLEKLIK